MAYETILTETRGPVALRPMKGVQLVSRRAPAQKRLRHLVPKLADRRVLVEHVEVRVRIEQRLMLVLSMEIHEPRRQVFQRACRHQRPVDERPASTLGRDFAARDQILAVHAEFRLDCGGLFSRADQIGRSAAAEQEADGLDEDGLAGACLPGEHVESRFEADLQRFDHSEILDAQESQHGPRRSGSRNAELP